MPCSTSTAIIHTNKQNNSPHKNPAHNLWSSPPNLLTNIVSIFSKISRTIPSSMCQSNSATSSNNKSPIDCLSQSLFPTLNNRITQFPYNIVSSNNYNRPRKTSLPPWHNNLSSPNNQFSMRLTMHLSQQLRARYTPNSTKCYWKNNSRKSHFSPLSDSLEACQLKLKCSDNCLFKILKNLLFLRNIFTGMLCSNCLPWLHHSKWATRSVVSNSMSRQVPLTSPNTNNSLHHQVLLINHFWPRNLK